MLEIYMYICVSLVILCLFTFIGIKIYFEVKRQRFDQLYEEKIIEDRRKLINNL